MSVAISVHSDDFAQRVVFAKFFVAGSLTAMNSTQNVLPPTQHRVSEQTRPRVHARIWEQTRRNVEKYSSGAGSERNIKLTERLKQLDREWDTERMLEANASAVILICLTVAIALTIFLPERSFGKHASPVDYVKAYPAIAFFAAFPIVVAAFLLQHALQGWCPPLPVFRYFV